MAKNHRSRQARLARQQLIIAAVLASVLVLAVGAYVSFRMMSARDSGVAETRSHPFNAADFKWPILMEHLNDGSINDAINTDEAVFILYYLKEMNEVFGDPDMKVFIDAACFTSVYDSEMHARLQAVFWTKVLPKALWDLGALVKDDAPLADAIASRYPILAGAVRGLAQEVPKGTLDRLFILGNLPRILQAKAKQDALTLFSTYGCSSEVTRRIYSNAVSFVKSYGVRNAS